MPAMPGAVRYDDFAACGIERAEDIRDLFCKNFHFGCEADDPMNAWGFDARVNPFGARLKTLFGSDIGHFDVPDMREVLPEAHELLDEGHFEGRIAINRLPLRPVLFPCVHLLRDEDGALRIPIAHPLLVGDNLGPQGQNLDTDISLFGVQFR